VGVAGIPNLLYIGARCFPFTSRTDTVKDRTQPNGPHRTRFVHAPLHVHNIIYVMVVNSSSKTHQVDCQSGKRLMKFLPRVDNSRLFHRGSVIQMIERVSSSSYDQARNLAAFSDGKTSARNCATIGLENPWYD